MELLNLNKTALTDTAGSTIRRKQDLVTRIIAGENIKIVRHNKSSAYFDLVNRVIYKPDWDSDMIRNNSDVSDLIDIHEVTHALMTPSDHKITHTINVLEDKRIEKLIKRKYNGVAPIMARGYKILYENDFFGIKNKTIEEINSLNLIDRLNIQAKIGFIIPVQFSPEEAEIVRDAEQMETFDDVLLLAKKIKEFMKEQNQQEPESKSSTFSDEAGASDESEENDEPSDSPSEEDEFTAPDEESEEGKESSRSQTDNRDAEEKEEEEKKGKKTMSDGSEDNEDSVSQQQDDDFEPESETIRNFDEKMDSMVDSKSNIRTVEIGKLTIDPEVQYKNLRTKLSEQLRIAVPFLSKTNDKVYTDVLSSIDRSANLLYREFELRKNAAERIRDRITTTGKIDVKRLSKYKITDKIFKQVTTRAEGKNHGFVFYLDVSGSMGGPVMKSTIKQLLTITSFCDKANIPYMVFAYTTSYEKDDYDFDNGTTMRVCQASHQLLMDSSLPKSERDLSKMLLANIMVVPNYYGMLEATGIRLYDTTPSLESLLVTSNVVKLFFEKNRVEKRNIVFMSDGDPSDPEFLISRIKNGVTETGITNNRRSSYDVIDNVTKKTYRDVDSYSSLAVTLDLVATRCGAATTYIHLVKNAAGIGNSNVYFDFWKNSIVDKSYGRVLYYTSRGVPGPSEWNGNKDSYSTMRETAGYKQLIKDIGVAFRKEGFYEAKIPMVDSAFFIRCDNTTDDHVENLTLDANESASKLGKKLASAINADSSNKILISTLADKFNYF